MQLVSLDLDMLLLQKKELIYFSAAGIPNIEVLKTATSNPTKYYNLKNLGSISEGYMADLLLLDKSPIENIENLNSITRIWKAGKEVKR